jgi:hypothetical protein
MVIFDYIRSRIKCVRLIAEMARAAATNDDCCCDDAIAIVLLRWCYCLCLLKKGKEAAPGV